MPIYPFRCLACDYTMEELYGVNESKPVVCPKCGQSTLRQEVGMPVKWFPHPVIFQNSQARQEAISKAANLMVKNGDDLK